MSKLGATVIGGIGATAIMSAMSALISMAGGPKMSSALLLAYLLQVSPTAGWMVGDE
jgi:hypothetical protein